jgi:hypothetical protein
LTEREPERLPVQLLANGSDPAVFDSLFDTAFVPVGWKDLDYVLALDRTFTIRLRPLLGKTWNEKTQDNDLGKLNSDDRTYYTYASSSVTQISRQIGSVLKTSRPAGSAVDLSATLIYTSDWQGVNLDGANMENVMLSEVNLKDASLGNVTQFTDISLLNVAWWEAKAMSPQLLSYLEEKYQCDPRGKYGVKMDETFTAQQCSDAIDRLRHGAR